MEFYDLLPEDPKLYDKMRPPKKDGQATVVYFHVTVMGLDSIDETSMVSLEFHLFYKKDLSVDTGVTIFFFNFSDIRGGYLLCTNVER